MKFDVDSIDIAYLVAALLFVWAASDLSPALAKAVAGIAMLLPVLIALAGTASAPTAKKSD